jgi:hypothetical protein
MLTWCAHAGAPLAGARIASLVVSKPELFEEWNEEMRYMSGRIKAGFSCPLPCCNACQLDSTALQN